MKLRKGFVSNSSSSSFVCDFCGSVESGYDACLSDFDMSMCEHGHTFCNDHTLNSFSDADTQEIYEYILNNYEVNLKSYKETLKKYQDKKDGKLPKQDWELNDPNYIDRMIVDYTKSIEDKEKEIAELKSDYETLEDEYFNDKYSNDLYDMVSDCGVPEKYCPVCERLAKMKQDEKYEEYKILYEHFDGVTPDGCK